MAALCVQDNLMALPIFQKQPNEINDLQPSVIRFLEGEGLSVYDINGLFDLMVISPFRKSDSYIELKVRLQTQQYKCPVTVKQWQMLNQHNVTSTFESNYRALIYDQRTHQYALATASNLKAGIASNQPNDTSYISKGTLDSLAWANEKVTSQILLSWVRR